MAAKRSPILGYNHNVRYRGIVFHIQTEDSGIINPHVFTHLFHGGVIISTRKLVYDPDANDEAVKALMQAQHKAVMKDLRRGTFDEKIDQYLGGTPGLLPREAVADEPAAAPAAPVAEAASAVEPVASAVEPVAPVAAPAAAVAVAPPFEAPPEVAAAPLVADASEAIALVGDEPSSPLIEIIPASEALEAAPPLDLPAPALDLGPPAPALVIDDSPSQEIEILHGADSVPDAYPIHDATIPMQVIPDMPLARPGDTLPVVISPRPGQSTPPPVRVAFTHPDAARAPTERVPSDLVAAGPDHLEAGGVASAQKDVSAAMRAIQVTDEELAAAGLGEVAEIHSPAPPSAPAPPGAQPERAGAYHLGRKTGVQEAVRPPIPRPTPTPPSRPPIRPATPPPIASRQPPPVPPRTATPASTPTPTASRVPTPRPVPPIPAPRPAAAARPAPPPRTPTPPANAVPRPGNVPGTGPTRARPTAGGVVVSRPAVIVGGKGAPTTPPKVRRAREAEGFGGDLISERSLDEVILAYLSEDTNDE